MKVALIWYRSVELPDGALIEDVEYKIVANVTKDEHEFLEVSHVSQLPSGREWFDKLNVDQWDATLTKNQRKDIAAKLDKAAAEKYERTKADSAELRRESREER